VRQELHKKQRLLLRTTTLETPRTENAPKSALGMGLLNRVVSA
jgi:hypothetical protein